MSTENTSSPMAMVDIFVAPKSVFDNLLGNGKWAWLSLLLIIAVLVGSKIAFFSGMSSDWIVEQQLAQAGEMTASEAAQAREGMTMMAEYTGIISSIAGSIIFVILTALSAAYYMVISNVAATKTPEFSFGNWFTFAVWTQMPTIINTIGFIVLFAGANTADLPLTLGSYASVNQLFLSYVPGDALFNWAETLNLFLIWGIALAAIGFNRCCDMSAAKSLFFAVLPSLVIFGVWFGIAAS